jgi:hypothetical protein
LKRVGSHRVTSGSALEEGEDHDSTCAAGLSPAAFIGSHVDLHYGNDDSSGPDDLGKRTGRWSVDHIVKRISPVGDSVVLVWNTEKGQEHLLGLSGLDTVG